MSKKTFCPFIGGHCMEKCMFYSSGASIEPDGIERNCIIAKTLVELPDSEHQETALSTILAALKKNP